MASIAGKWGWSDDGERFVGEFRSAADALREGLAELGAGSIWVGQYREVQQPEEVYWLDAWDVFAAIGEHEEYDGDWSEGYPGLTEAQARELGLAFRKMFGGFLDKHKLRPRFGIIDENTVRRGSTPRSKTRPRSG